MAWVEWETRYLGFSSDHVMADVAPGRLLRFIMRPTCSRVNASYAHWHDDVAVVVAQRRVIRTLRTKLAGALNVRTVEPRAG